MGLPDDTCLEATIDIQAMLGLAINMPGGVAIQAQLEPGEFPNLGTIVGKLLMPLNSAMTPLMPFFRILDVVIQLIACAKAVPDSLGPPPDPSKLVKPVVKLLKAASKLAPLVPQLSIPIMVVGVCKVVVAGLSALVEQLEFQIAAATKLSLAQAKADALAADPETQTGAVVLQASIDCAQADLAVALELGSKSLGPLNKFIELLNAIAGLAGLPEFANIEASGDAGAMLQPLKDAIAAINTVCGSIPV